MEKEKALEIEIIKINDKYSAFYPVKMDIEKLKKIANGKSLGDGEYIPYIDLSINGYGYSIFLTTEEIFPQVIKNKCINELKEEIEKLSEKCSLLKRWRADEKSKYYFLGSHMDILSNYEYYDIIDNERYELGNYFKTEEEAEKVANSKEYKDFWAKVRAGEIGSEE